MLMGLGKGKTKSRARVLSSTILMGGEFAESACPLPWLPPFSLSRCSNDRFDLSVHQRSSPHHLLRASSSWLSIRQDAIAPFRVIDGQIQKLLKFAETAL